MLYLDYGREPGEWIPNQYGGKENLEAIEFLKHVNSILHQRFPGVLTIAEESTAFAGVTTPVERGGLGFDLKWNMGWMNDTLRYFTRDPIYRQHHQNDLTFGLLYAFSERFCLVLSHDEVVHGKGSLLSKMPCDTWQQFANARLLLSYMMCQPGKKLLFMGGEFGQWNEWQCSKELDWILLTFPIHCGLQNMVKELNHFYQAHRALWERDFDYTGFEWVDLHDRQNCVISYLRKATDSILLCVHNFSPNCYEHYVVPCRNLHSAQEIFNSDALKYGGSDKVNSKTTIDDNGVAITLAPLATMIFEVRFR
jgi:1,4-alpha-glucan branching enzyme